MQHFLNLSDLKKREIEKILREANKDVRKDVLRKKVLALIFEKRSTRTRLSLEVAMEHLGGNAIFLGKDDIHLGVNESLEDTVRVLNKFVDAVAFRVFEHSTLEEMSERSEIPIINALSNLSHPCQALADLLVIKNHFKKLNGINLTYIGDGNNVCNSLIEASIIFGMNFNFVGPRNYLPNKYFINLAKRSNINFRIINKPEVPNNSQVIYTDTWISMGDEKEKEKRLKDFKLFQVNKNLLKNVKEDYLFMHCLPSHRGVEVTDEVIDGSHSVVFEEAHDRLLTTKALLVHLMK